MTYSLSQSFHDEASESSTTLRMTTLPFLRTSSTFSGLRVFSSENST